MRIGTEQRERGPVEADDLARLRVEHRPPRVGRSPQLDDVRAVVEPCRDVHDEGSVQAAGGVGLGGDGGAGVDDDEVTRCELLGEVAEDAMSDVTRTACDEEADGVAGDAAVLRRRGREGHGGHDATPVRLGATSAAR